MLRPAIHSTDDPPVPIEDLLLREYVFALRRRIEVMQDLMDALTDDVRKARKERDTIATELERLTVDLHWHEYQRKIKP